MRQQFQKARIYNVHVSPSNLITIYMHATPLISGYFCSQLFIYYTFDFQVNGYIE